MSLFNAVTPMGLSSLLILLQGADVVTVHTENLVAGVQRNRVTHKRSCGSSGGGLVNKCLPCEYETLISISRTHVFKKKKAGGQGMELFSYKKEVR